MLCGVVLDALLCLVVDGDCRLLEEGGLLQSMKVDDHYVENVYESSTREKKISNLPKIFWKIQYLFCYFSFCTGRTYIYYVDNVCEISVKEKEFPSSKDPPEDSIYFYCFLRTRKRV